MSLLVVNSSSRVAQGVIKHLHKTGKFQTINCADLYPNYWGIQSQVDFLGSMKQKESKTQLLDTHIQDKQDLSRSISAASHVLYITHDYYTNASAKVNLIRTTADLVQHTPNIQSFVALTPNELDHYSEQTPNSAAIESEAAARQISDHLVTLRSDLTFGHFSTAVQELIRLLQSSSNIAFQTNSPGVAPIHNNCLAHGVAALLESGTKYHGKSFIAEGQKRISWQSVINTLEQATSSHKQLNTCKLQWAISPQQNNLLSEFLYSDKYRNLVQYITKHQPLNEEKVSNITELGVKPLDFETYYKENPINRQDGADRGSQGEQYIKNFVY